MLLEFGKLLRQSIYLSSICGSLCQALGTQKMNETGPVYFRTQIFPANLSFPLLLNLPPLSFLFFFPYLFLSQFMSAVSLSHTGSHTYTLPYSTKRKNPQLGVQNRIFRQIETKSAQHVCHPSETNRITMTCPPHSGVKVQESKASPALQTKRKPLPIPHWLTSHWPKKVTKAESKVKVRACTICLQQVKL